LAKLTGVKRFKMASISQEGAISGVEKGGRMAVYGLYIRKSNNIGCQALFKAKNGVLGGFSVLDNT
jgi:hypothetical protein